MGFDGQSISVQGGWAPSALPKAEKGCKVRSKIPQFTILRLGMGDFISREKD